MEQQRTSAQDRRTGSYEVCGIDVPAPHGMGVADVVEGFGRACALAGDVAGVHLWMEDADSATVRLVTASGHLRPSSDPVPVEGSALGRTLSGGGARLAPHEDGDGRWRYAVPVAGEGIRGVAAADFLGDAPDLETLTRVTAHYRPLLAAALSRHAADLRSHAASALLGAVGDLSRSFDRHRLADTIVRHAMDLAHASTGSLMLASEDRTLSIVSATGLPDDVVARTRVRAGEGIAGWVLATGRPIAIEDLVEKPHGHRHGVRSAFSIPLADECGVLGVLNVGARTFTGWPRSVLTEGLEALGRAGAASLRVALAHDASRDLYFQTLRSLAGSVSLRAGVDGSSERLLRLATDLGRALGMAGRELESLRIAVFVHDLGLLGIGTDALGRDRPLSTVEWGLVKLHPEIAAEAVSRVASLSDVAPVVRHHHERFDGSGYVEGLAGADIPLGARVLALADAYVAMTARRAWGDVPEPAEALERIRAEAGSRFDPAVVEALEHLLAAGDPAEAY